MSDLAAVVGPPLLEIDPRRLAEGITGIHPNGRRQRIMPEETHKLGHSNGFKGLTQAEWLAANLRVVDFDNGAFLSRKGSFSRCVRYMSTNPEVMAAWASAYRVPPPGITLRDGNRRVAVQRV